MTAPGRKHVLLVVGRLLRLSLLPSALADAVCGLAIGAGGWPGPLALLALVASAGLFHGGMALNDWADRDVDRLTRPDRPVPSGRIAPSFAFGLGAVLLVVGVAAAAAIGSLALGVAAVLAALVVLYDTVLRGPIVGPLLLASCRATDLVLGAMIGAQLAGVPLDERIALPAVAYGCYVFVVARLGRLEDDLDRQPGARPRRALFVAAGLLVLAPLATVPYGAVHGDIAWTWVGAALVVALAGAYGLVREARARAAWTHAEVERAMGLVLRRLALVTCALALASGAPVLGGAILLAYPVSTALRRVFPPS